MPRLRRSAITLVLLTLSACLPPTPYPGTTDLPVPYHEQENSYFCVPAAVQMWRQYKWGAADVSQTQIWDYMYFLGGATPGVGARLSGVSAAVANYVQSTEDGFYQSNADTVGLRQAIADQTKSIDERQPLIVATQQETHVVVLKGVTWRRLEDALARPSMEYAHVNDPGLPGGQNASYTFGTWMNVQILIQVPPCYSWGCVYQWQRWGLKGAGISGLDEFEVEGGTYLGEGPSNPTGRWKEDGWGGCYWEPNDSGPDQCSGSAPTGRYKLDSNGCYWDPNDSGPDQCVPPSARLAPAAQPLHVLPRVLGVLRDLLAKPDFRASMRRPPIIKTNIAFTRRSGSASSVRHAQLDETSKAATRNGTLIPHPYATKDSEILENVVAAIRQSHLDEAWQMPELAMRKGELRARRILDVTSLTKQPDFYVVELLNGSGRLVANVAIYKSGILIGAQRIDHPELQYPLDLADARTRAKRFGPPRRARYVHLIGPGEVGSPVFIPLAAVELSDGTVYFNSHGDAFAEESSGLAKRVGVTDDKPLPPGMMKIRRLKDR